MATAQGEAAAFAAVLAALAEGRLTPEEAAAVTALLEAHVRAHEAAGRRRKDEEMEALFGDGILGWRPLERSRWLDAGLGPLTGTSPRSATVGRLHLPPPGG